MISVVFTDTENSMFNIVRSLLFPKNRSTAPAPISTDSILKIMDAHLKEIYNPITPAPDAPPRTPFASSVPANQVSMMNFTPRQRLAFLRHIGPLFINMWRGARLYGKPFVAQRTHITTTHLAELEAFARSLGAKDIGYVDVPNHLIFKGKRLPHRHAIVFTVEMQKDAIATSPSFESMLEVSEAYKNLAIIGWNITAFLRKRGFAAYPGTALGGLTDYPHLAERAGLGAIGYHGLLISPTDGARMRINVIYTNIENLPQATVNPHQWVRDFCAMCQKCVRSCPVNAIYEEPQPRTGGGFQSIDHATCRDYFTRNFGCGVCMAVCPFSQAGYQRIKHHFKGNADAAKFVIPLT
jgi:ferredoxin